VGSAEVVDIMPSKARYEPGAEVVFDVELAGGPSPFKGVLTFRVYHLDTIVHQELRTITLPQSLPSVERFVWTAPDTDFTGYLATADVGDGPLASTGVDVSSHPYRYPRYGFISEFSSALTPEQIEARAAVLARRYLIDLVQLYDWQWRHEKLLSEADGEIAGTWTDLLGREISWNAVQRYVESAHRHNVAVLAYVMIYAAREGYAERFPISPQWGIFADQAAQNQLHVRFDNGAALYLFDPSNANWQDWMIPQFADAVQRGRFDGVHIDQLGARYNVYGGDSRPVHLPHTFPLFLSETKRRLADASERNACTFNIVDGAVGGWAVEEVARSEACDILYSELWFATNTYHDLRLYIESLRNLGKSKAVVLAAYSQYGEQVGDILEAEDAHLVAVGSSADHPGYTGSGFVDQFDTVGDAISWQIELLEEQAVTLLFRYANATGQTATRHLLVDDRTVAHLSFSSRDQWSTWDSNPYFQLRLSAGKHDVRLSYAADDTTAINVDHLRLSSFSETAVRLEDAVMFASGAFHIELGDDEQVLAHEYFPNRSKSLTPQLKRALARYYRFAAAYENVLFDSDVLPVIDAPSSLELPDGPPLSETGGNVILPIVRRRPGMEILHFVNLMGVPDDRWRDSAPAPQPQENLRVRWRAGGGLVADSAFWASPDVAGGAPQPLQISEGTDAQGSWIEMTLPRLAYWDMIVVRTRVR
jgi:hypothetical protein